MKRKKLQQVCAPKQTEMSRGLSIPRHTLLIKRLYACRVKDRRVGWHTQRK